MTTLGKFIYSNLDIRMKRSYREVFRLLNGNRPLSGWSVSYFHGLRIKSGKERLPLLQDTYFRKNTGRKMLHGGHLFCYKRRLQCLDYIVDWKMSPDYSGHVTEGLIEIFEGVYMPDKAEKEKQLKELHKGAWKLYLFLFILFVAVLVYQWIEPGLEK